MTMQSRLDSISLSMLAICAAKAIQTMYPYMKVNTEETITEFANGTYSSYSVFAGNGERLVDVYRWEDDKCYHHFWTPHESDTFLVEDYEGDNGYRVFSREDEFEELFLKEIENI